MEYIFYLPNQLIYEVPKEVFRDIPTVLVYKYLKRMYPTYVIFETTFLKKISGILPLHSLYLYLQKNYHEFVMLDLTEVGQLTQKHREHIYHAFTLESIFNFLPHIPVDTYILKETDRTTLQRQGYNYQIYTLDFSYFLSEHAKPYSDMRKFHKDSYPFGQMQGERLIITIDKPPEQKVFWLMYDYSYDELNVAWDHKFKPFRTPGSLL